jgi:hypothetical protein
MASGAAAELSIIGHISAGILHVIGAKKALHMYGADGIVHGQCQLKIMPMAVQQA